MATSPQVADQNRSDRAIDHWSPLIIAASRRYAIPGRNELEDLTQEGLTQLAEMLRDHSDWDFNSSDFSKLFKNVLFHRMTDLARTARRKKRNINLEVSLKPLTDKRLTKREKQDHIDPRSEYDSPEKRVIGHDMYSKVLNELDEDQRNILTLLVHPTKQYVAYCADKAEVDDATALDNVRRFLFFTQKEMDYHMERIRNVTANIQSDYRADTLHSVVHVLALPEDRGSVPYWCAWECLDKMCRRLLAQLTFSDLPIGVGLTQLSNILHQPREKVIDELDQIKKVVVRLYSEGITVPEPNRARRVCCVADCKDKAYFTCYETNVRGCEKHLIRCKHNPRHYIVPSMLETHEKNCVKDVRKHARNCQYPDCTSRRYSARCHETGLRGCDQHLICCLRNHNHRYFKEEQEKHEQHCKPPMDRGRRKKPEPCLQT